MFLYYVCYIGSRDIRTIFRTLRAGRFYHAPLIEKVDWNEAWAAVERANNLFDQAHKSVNRGNNTALRHKGEEQGTAGYIVIDYTNNL